MGHCKYPYSNLKDYSAYLACLLCQHHIYSDHRPHHISRGLRAVPCLFDDLSPAPSHVHQQLVHGLIPPNGKRKMLRLVLFNMSAVEVSLLQWA